MAIVALDHARGTWLSAFNAGAKLRMIERVNNGFHFGASPNGAGPNWVVSSRKDLVR